jgi:hypothetical protein
MFQPKPLTGQRKSIFPQKISALPTIAPDEFNPFIRLPLLPIYQGNEIKPCKLFAEAVVKLLIPTITDVVRVDTCHTQTHIGKASPIRVFHLSHPWEEKIPI